MQTGTPSQVANESASTPRTAWSGTRPRRLRARDEAPKELTLVHKHNVLVNAGGLWNRLFTSVGLKSILRPATDDLHIDAATIMMVADPQRFDVIVTDNLFGDIIT